MATMVRSFAIQGIDGYAVDIETKTLEGQPMISIIGLGDLAVKEAAERIQAAIDESGYVFPRKRVIISLAPSDKKKSGSHFDLAMAIGVLQQSGDIGAKNLGDYGFIGELSLDGTLRACRGILPMIIAAQKSGLKKIIIPISNLKEARLVHGIEVLGFHDLGEVIHYLEGRQICANMDQQETDNFQAVPEHPLDFSDVKGQDELIDAVVLAAAGGHNMLMIGEPGCGKTMIAQRIPSILPEMTEEECLEVTKIYSISGLLPNGHSLIKCRPFRAPHHNASLNALVGGGVNAMPGEVSLAHNGVLFLDELAEFPRRTLDALRQPIEDKKVSISRVNGSHTFPSNFMLIAAMNPCPCGYYPGSKCRCTDYEIIKYRGKISGPIMDRIDIQKEVHPVDFFSMEDKKPGCSSGELRKKVEQARKIQQNRYAKEPGINCNAQMTTALIQKYCVLDKESLTLLKETSEKYGYSARVIHKLLRLARTSADLDGVEAIRLKDIKKVLACRELDRSNSKMVVVKQ
ncbi:MAG: YifB family Mg chelatase-like AAA ATPase [Clostridia bacterium]|nr:YifB family Mg chelatase-like AAA ATPase [Clostridia bacterium]MDY5555992.1 YifB family Mg chelatase-like AAA ATPase [Blautia sp.]